MSDHNHTVNPLRLPASAAQQIIIELIRAGKINNSDEVNDSFTKIHEHFKRINNVKSI
ncbi:TPA: hypothetical protein H2U89_000314 [Salmonella enterica]|nr:hypothetical protein [Salmonella enterica subsp. enterica]EEC0182355.1 hypothetical protein [Salmonella enterica subsp. enterica serovar Abony]EEI4553604.1 hypothetical protein [Salmonella enterica]EHN2046198.1 hypothetical protein [Salmonella enterica subsp. enterica serovar Nima]HCM2545214.1 hypothetical protein [Salmonella enterica subsp. enterica serovar Durban]